MAKAKEKLIVSPRASLVFPAIHAPDTKFNSDGVYKADFALNPEDPEAKAFLGKLTDLFDERYAAWRADPANKKYLKTAKENPVFQDELDKEGDETGRILVKARSGYQPTVVDSQKTPIAPVPELWGGTVARVAVRPSFYFVPGSKTAGLKIYVEAVQIIEMRGPGGGSGADCFDEEDGFVTNEAPAGSDADEEEDDEDF